MDDLDVDKMGLDKQVESKSTVMVTDEYAVSTLDFVRMIIFLSN